MSILSQVLVPGFSPSPVFALRFAPILPLHRRGFPSPPPARLRSHRHVGHHAAAAGDHRHGFDFGRIYIARNEAQVFTDAAAMTAAARLDGTAPGLARAAMPWRICPCAGIWAPQPFTGVVIEFSADGVAVWERDPKTPRL